MLVLPSPCIKVQSCCFFRSQGLLWDASCEIWPNPAPSLLDQSLLWRFCSASVSAACACVNKTQQWLAPPTSLWTPRSTGLEILRITGFILDMDVCLDWQQEVLEPVFNAVESFYPLNEGLPDRWAEEMCNRRRQVGMFIVAIVCLILSPFCRGLCISWMAVTDWNVEAPSSNLIGGEDSGHFCEPTMKKQFARHRCGCILYLQGTCLCEKLMTDGYHHCPGVPASTSLIFNSYYLQHSSQSSKKLERTVDLCQLFKKNQTVITVRILSMLKLLRWSVCLK